MPIYRKKQIPGEIMKNKRVLLVGLEYTGPSTEHVNIEQKGLGQPEICEKEAAAPLYEYDVIIINPKSYSHFIFGKGLPESSFKNELLELKKKNNNYDIDTVFDFDDRMKELNIAIANGSTVIWLAVIDKKQSFFGQRSLYRAYLNGEVKNELDQSWIYQKQGKQYVVLKENQFVNYYKTLSKSGWNISWQSSILNETCFITTPEGYCLGCEFRINDKIAWLLSPPTSDEALYSLINSALATEAIAPQEVVKSSLEKDYSVKANYISSENVVSFSGSIKLLLITATEIETKTLRTYLKPLDGYDSILEGTIDDITYRLGKFGEYNAVHFQCGMGTVGRDSSLLSTYIAIRFWEPKAVVMIGIAFGRDPVKQNLGDVLVSEMISPYEPVRVGKEIIPRGPSSLAGPILLDRFRNMIDWKYQTSAGKSSRKIIGEILSGEKLVDDSAFKDQLFSLFPNAKGGEMEGAGIYAAATRAKVPEWILVKGICDWGDGAKTKEYQSKAADAAVSLCHEVFGNPHSFEDLPRTIELEYPSTVTPKIDQTAGQYNQNSINPSDRYNNNFSLRKNHSERDKVTDLIIGLDGVKSNGEAYINYTLPNGDFNEKCVKSGHSIDYNVGKTCYRLLIKYVNYSLDEVGVEISERIKLC
jgi:nucleoside phosphorylase